MNDYLLIARSVTQAQRVAAVLEGKGIRSTILRAPAALNQKGCSYALRFGGTEPEKVRQILLAAGIRPLPIYKKTGQSYEEVVL